MIIVNHSYPGPGVGVGKSGGNLSHNKQKCFKFLRGKLHSILKETERDIKQNLLSDDHP